MLFKNFLTHFSTTEQKLYEETVISCAPRDIVILFSHSWHCNRWSQGVSKCVGESSYDCPHTAATKLS